MTKRRNQFVEAPMFSKWLLRVVFDDADELRIVDVVEELVWIDVFNENKWLDVESVLFDIEADALPDEL